MSKYTIELRDLVNSGFKIFDNSWNTYDPNHKTELCEKIIKHYYFYEIGQETPQMFKHYINEHIARIMPYYNQLYASELLKFEPLYNAYMEMTGENTSKRINDNSRGKLTSDARLINMANSIREMLEENEGITANVDFTGDITGTMDKTTTENETTDTDDKTIRSEDEKDNRVINEVVDETVGGTKDITSNTKGTTSSSRFYSDTPQKQITGEELRIRKDYLTNYTEESGASNTDTTSKETIKTDTDRTTNTKDDLTKDIDENIDRTINEKRDLTRNENENTTEKTTEHTTDINKTDKSSDKQTFSNGTQKEARDGSEQETEKLVERVKASDTTKYKGFNIDQSTLLMRFRETFINIDEMIINELGNNFMEVF